MSFGGKLVVPNRMTNLSQFVQDFLVLALNALHLWNFLARGKLRQPVTVLPGAVLPQF